MKDGGGGDGGLHFAFSTMVKYQKGHLEQSVSTNFVANTA